jgi:hypothetical protein
MSRFLIIDALSIVAACASVVSLCGQTSGPTIEEQLRKEYVLTRVGTNGVLMHAGIVFTVQVDGIKSNPASYMLYWPNIYKKGDGRVKQRMMTAKAGISKVNREEIRFLQVGEKVYLTQMDMKDADLVLSVQSCGSCSSSGPDPNDVPYRAEISFQLGKGYLNNSTFKEIQETIGQVFAIDTTTATRGADQAPTPTAASPRVAPPAIPLKLPAIYVSAQSPADVLQLKGDNSFSLQEGGQSYHGTFTDNGTTLELSIVETNSKTTVTKQGGSLADSSGQTWVLRDQPAAGAASAEVLRNEDIISLTKVGLDDATILAKIAASRCQFDTSTSGLVQLKQNGVSAGVIKAVVKAMAESGK